MPKIGVTLPSRVVDSGECLVDARALDAAGVDSLWLDDEGDEPWLVLAGVAAVTGGARLVVPVAAPPGRALDALAARIDTLNRLSRGRVVLGLRGAAAHEDAIRDVLALARAAKCCALVHADTTGQARLAEREAHGVVARGESAERFRAGRGPVARPEPQRRAGGDFERWARVPMPEDPAQWRRLRRDYDEAGATGLVVPADPRLLDLVRNGDEEEDRSDLQLAQG